jgi:hypothetical protein
MSTPTQPQTQQTKPQTDKANGLKLELGKRALKSDVKVGMRA